MDQLLKDLLGTILYTYGFTLIYGVSRASQPAAIGCALVSWLTNRFLLELGFDPVPAAFCATLLLTLYAEVMARKLKRPASSFLLMGLLALVPGGSIYRAMFHLVDNNQAAATQSAIEAFGLAAALAMGVVCMTTFFRVKPSPRIRRRTKGSN